MSGEWHRPQKYIGKSKKHGIINSDGVEFDLRLSMMENWLFIMILLFQYLKKNLKDAPKWVDSWSLDELRDVGVTSFEDFIQDPGVQNQWIEEGKMACLEFKRPHLLSPNGRGFLNKKRQYRYMSNAMQLAEQILDKNEIPKENSVFYAFFRGMRQVIEGAEIKRNWAELMPSIPSIGNRTFKRAYAYPQYMTMPFSRLVKRHRKAVRR